MVKCYSVGMNQVERENNSLWKIREVLIESWMAGILRDEYDHSQQNGL